MSVLFLDIDGVLNSIGTRPQDPTGLSAWLDPRNVRHLDTILRAANPDVVVTSSWRLSNDIGELTRQLAAAGCNARIVGATPFLDSYRRAIEIQAWLDDADPKPARFAILEDEQEMEHLEAHLVRTSKVNGLLEEHVERVLALLS